MRVCAVICEYNPFHNGHAYHLAQARRASGADYVLCLMSGALTQRGTFARHDKWTRAHMALLGGADVVLELPTRFSCASAPEFAGGGVALLESLRVVTHLSFGCEPSALPYLDQAAALLRDEPPALREALRQGLSGGQSFPRALAESLQHVCGTPGLSQHIAQPNAALALEYLRALPASIKPVPVAREGSGYHDETLGALSSATAVRAALARGDKAEAFCAVPCPDLLEQAERSGRIHEEEALTQSLLYRLRTMQTAQLASINGMDEGLEHRFLRAAQTCQTRQALIGAVKSKRYTHARLSRLCACVLLDMTRTWARENAAPGYARVLGFRRAATPLLAAIKASSRIPLVVKAADFDRTQPLFALDVRAQDLWALGCRSPLMRASGQDFTTSPVIV